MGIGSGNSIKKLAYEHIKKREHAHGITLEFAASVSIQDIMQKDADFWPGPPISARCQATDGLGTVVDERHGRYTKCGVRRRMV